MALKRHLSLRVAEVSYRLEKVLVFGLLATYDLCFSLNDDLREVVVAVLSFLFLSTFFIQCYS
jgi:hypothetical protein